MSKHATHGGQSKEFSESREGVECAPERINLRPGIRYGSVETEGPECGMSSAKVITALFRQFPRCTALFHRFNMPPKRHAGSASSKSSHAKQVWLTHRSSEETCCDCEHHQARACKEVLFRPSISESHLLACSSALVAQADIAKFFGGGSKPHSTAIKANVITPSHSSADSPRVKRQKQASTAHVAKGCCQPSTYHGVLLLQCSRPCADCRPVHNIFDAF